MIKSTNQQKYETSNPIVKRLINRVLDKVTHEVEVLAPNRVVDFGCGEGFVINKLQASRPRSVYLGIDISEQALRIAKISNPDAIFIHGDIMSLNIASKEDDVFICLEVLEHISKPNETLELMSSMPQKAVIISVPWEPWFQVGNFLRGKYLARLGNHPEHVQRFNPYSINKLVGNFFTEIKVIDCFPWVIVVAKND